MKGQKTLFFATNIVAAWPEEFPCGRIVEERYRHLTLAFLGGASHAQLKTLFPLLVCPSFRLGMGGYFDRWVFLPQEKRARVVAAGLHWLCDPTHFLKFQSDLVLGLKNQGYLAKEPRLFFPHVTITRGTFSIQKWKQFPSLIPFYFSSITLQESLGNSRYQTLEEYPLLAPFEEVEHTADIAFHIRGKDWQELWQHAVLALAFKCPSLLLHLRVEKKWASLDDVIAALNNALATTDQLDGIPVKAVSYHDELVSRSDNLLEWTMIVDV